MKRSSETVILEKKERKKKWENGQSDKLNLFSPNECKRKTTALGLPLHV